MSNIPQADGKGKAFNENVEYLDFARCDSNLEYSRISGVLRGKLIEQILSGTNEQALAVLSSVGTIRFIPGIGASSIPLNEFAAFYGVAEGYLRNLLVRRGLIRKNYPDDINRWDTSGLLKAGAPISPCGCEKDGLVKYHFNDSRSLYVMVPYRHMFSTYSTRIVLAASLFMCYTDKSGQDGNIQRAILAIKRSPYRLVEKEPEVIEETPPTEGVAGIPITQSGEFVLSPELFAQVIKIAVKEAVSEVMAASKVSEPKKRGKI